MTATDQTQQDPCPNCVKPGLPILPVRYAVARDDAAVAEKAPPLCAPFAGADIALPENSARYTLRTLRSGYLYVFNETRGAWSAYEVDEYGTLHGFDHRDPSPPPPLGDDEIREVCSRHGNPELGRCVIVPDAHKTGAVWFGFSDVAWTPAVWRKHKQQAYREKHMRRVDVGAWVKGQGQQTQPHLDSLSKLTAHVGEFALPLPSNGPGESEAEREARRARNQARETKHAARREQAIREGREPDDEPLEVELEAVTVVAKPYPAFDFSLADFHNSAGMAEDFQEQAAEAGELGKAAGGSPGPYPPAMVALEDPAGMAMDLASLMNERLSEFMVQPSLKRPLAVSTLMASLEEAVRNNAELDLVKSAQDKAAQDLEYWRGIPWATGEGPRDPARYQMETQHHERMRNDPGYRAEWERKVEQAREDALSGIGAQELQNSSDSAWRKYRKKLQDGQPGKWQRETYQPALQKFDREVIVPLAHAHVAWLKSPQMVGCMSCNHDENDPASGVAYCDTVLLCIQDTQSIAINAKQYVEWLGAQDVEEGNLLLRAISLNQKAVVESLASGAGIGLRQAGTLPWGTLLEGYRRALHELPASQQNTPARLLMAVAGPVMTALDRALNRGVGPLVIGLGLVARQPVVYTQLTGSLEQAVDDLVERMVRANPELGRLDRDRLRTRMRNQSQGNRQTTRARGAGRRGQNTFQIRVDQLALGEIDGSMSPREQLRRAGQSVMSFDDWQRSPQSRWRTLTNGINGGIVGVLLSVWSLKSLAKELDESTDKTRKENGWRYSAAILGVVAAVSDGLHTALENGRQAGSRLAVRIGETWSRFLRVTGRALGFAAAVIFAFWDLKNAADSFGRGEIGMGALYVVSAVSAVGAFAVLAGWFGPLIFGLSATGVGIVLAAIAVLVAALIMLFKDDNLEAWMRRCWFGTAGGARFGSQKEEMAELDALLKANLGTAGGGGR
ncbi:T6SS effector BTH_I2691 family protein [Luteimonas suaedae]|uniref:T6SS effector BTH_I2691 family protein n=1 Tax=Luteimonas suaedae TaxID=2605430 RepID=UPI0011EFFA74|nr:T6SS effector BTH_I2691 family protein [Luteimonas suaedae]